MLENPNEDEELNELKN